MVCGICKQESGELGMIRLAEADMQDQKYPSPKLPGLYRCCKGCLDTYTPIVVTRLGLDPDDFPGNLLV